MRDIKPLEPSIQLWEVLIFEALKETAVAKNHSPFLHVISLSRVHAGFSLFPWITTAMPANP